MPHRIRIILVGTLAAVVVVAAGAAQKITPAMPAVARPLPLTAVRLTGGPLKRAQDLTADYLLPLEPDRMLAEFTQGADTRSVNQDGRPGRGAGGNGWFAYDLPVDPAHPMSLVVTYYRDSRRPRRFDILVDGARLAAVTLEASSEAAFQHVEYSIPAEIARGKEKITVRFQSAGAGEVGPVFGIRTIRADAPR